MNKFRFAVLLILLQTSLTLSGQDVKISGNGNGYAGAVLRVSVQTDPLTKSQKPFKRITCDAKGSFSFSVPVKGSGTIFLRAGVFTWYLYVTEGKEYTIRLNDFIAKSPEEEQNIFFEEVKMIPEVISDSSDINNLIRIFDAEYDPAFNRIADRIAYNVNRSDIPAIIGKLNTLISPGMPQFFTDYVKFRMIMINMMAYGEYQGRIEDSVMINREFVPGNPAYPDLIEQRFTGFFSSILSGPFKNDFIRAIADTSLGDLRSVILKNGQLSNPELIDYLILLNLYPSWYDGSMPADNILNLVGSLRSSGSSDYIKQLAGVVSERMLALYAGTPAPQFSLKDADGNEVSLTAFAGSYLLLSIARSDNASVIEEYSLLNSWYKKYSSKMQLVTILVDRNFAPAAARLKSAGFGWTKLDGSAQDILEYNYNVKMYPSFILVGPDGKIICGSCPLPSENLERVLAAKLVPYR